MRRHDREFLLKVRSGVFAYDELVTMANEKIDKIDQLFHNCNLPELPDFKSAEEMLIEMREALY